MKMKKEYVVPLVSQLEKFFRETYKGLQRILQRKPDSGR